MSRQDLCERPFAHVAERHRQEHAGADLAESVHVHHLAAGVAAEVLGALEMAEVVDHHAARRRRGDRAVVVVLQSLTSRRRSSSVMTNSSDQKSSTDGLTSLSQASSTPSDSRNESSVSTSPLWIISRLSTDETLTCSPGTSLKIAMASSAASKAPG